MRLHKLVKGLTLGAGLLFAVGASAQSDTSAGSSGATQDQSGAMQGQTGASQDQSGNLGSPSTGSQGASQGSQGSMGTQGAQASHQINGTVSKVGSDKFTLKTDDGSKLTLHTDPQTKVYDQSGNTASLSQLQEGSQVRASYDVRGDQNHASRIDVINSGTPSGGGSMQQQPGTSGSSSGTSGSSSGTSGSSSGTSGSSSGGGQQY